MTKKTPYSLHIIPNQFSILRLHQKKYCNFNLLQLWSHFVNIMLPSFHFRVDKKKENTMAKPVKQPKIAGFFGVSQAKDIGISKATLSRLAAKNKILRLGHGMYLHPDSKISQVSPEEQDYAQACSKFGHDSYIGGLTALFYFGLIEQVPEQIWVIVPQTKQTSDTRYRLIRVKKISSIGIEERNFLRISNIERTLVESLVYSSKMGIRTAIFAIRRSIIGEKTTLEKFMDMAKKLGFEKILKKYWETLIASLETL